MNITISEEISRFVHQTGFDDFPKEVIEKSKQCILDIIGVTLYGSKYGAPNIALSLVHNFPNAKDATILGKKQKASIFFAAMINGISSHISDYDDQLKFFGHPSSVIMPSLLSLAESTNSNGRDILTGFILGVEAGSKLGTIMSANHYQAGFHTTSTIGSIAATIALSKLLKLTVLQTTNAIGIAASNASGIRQNFGTMTKAWHIGHASSVAIFSTLLAQKGFESSPEALEGPTGFINAFQGESRAYPKEELGNPYSILNIRIKEYPSCGATHAGIVATLSIREKIKNNIEEIKIIDCETTMLSKSLLSYNDPINIQQARFSLEYCIAVALLSGRVGPEQFTEEYFKSKIGKLKRIMRKINRKYNTEFDKIAKQKKISTPTRLTIVLKDETKYERFIDDAVKGLISWESVENKFFNCCDKIIGLEESKDIVEKVKILESVKNIKELTAKL